MNDKKHEMLEGSNLFKFNVAESYDFLGYKGFENLINSKIIDFLDHSVYRFLDVLPVSVYWKDLKGRYLGCNQYMLNMAGLEKREDVIGRTDRECVWSEIAPQLEIIDSNIIATNQTITIEETPRLANNEERVYLSIKQPLYDENKKIKGILGVSIDITEKKQAQEQKRLEKAKREQAEKLKEQEENFRKAVSVHSGSMAHDLNNPILANSLANEMNQMVLKKIQEKYNIAPEDLEPVYKKMAFIEENNQKMSEMIKGSNQMIQDIASEKQVLIQQEFSAYSLIKESLTNYFDDVQSGLIQFDLPQDFKFFTNKIAFLRIMFNLIDNAKRQIKLKNRGKIYISAEQTADFSMIKVKDTAGSVTKELIENIFSLYKDKKVQNTGLGLQAVSSLMQGQGGFVHARLVDEEYIEFVLGFKCF